MTARLPLVAACLGVLFLAACDAGSEVEGVDDPDRVSGVWEATVPFRADTILAEYNYRVKADYDVALRFDLRHDDGLVWGTITASLDGTVIAREAGTRADTFVLDPAANEFTTEVYGTYIRPELELDVPFGPYEDDLWTFEKVAGRLKLETDLSNLWRFVQRNTAEPVEFELDLTMEPREVSIVRRDGETPRVDEPDTPTEIPGNGALLTLDGGAYGAQLRALGPGR